MSKQEVRVGQVWRREGGAELAVTRVCAGIAHFKRRDSSTAAHVVAYMTPYNGWTLAAPEAACEECAEAQRDHGPDHYCSWAHSPSAQACKCRTQCDNPDACVTYPFQKDACSALLEQLPVSERFVVSRRDTHLAGVKAIADLRRKVMGHKAWPVCPVSKQDLRIKATVSEEHKSKGCFRPTETVRTWQAAFTCSHCTGGGR